MFKGLIAFIFVMSCAFSQVWMSEFATKGDIARATNGLTNGGGSGPAAPVQEYLIYSLAGNQVVASNQVMTHIPYNCTFGTNAGAALFTAATGTNFLFDVDLNGVTILSNMSIGDGVKTNLSRIYKATASMFDEIRIHIIQVGSIIQGSDLTILIPITRL